MTRQVNDAVYVPRIGSYSSDVILRIRCFTQCGLAVVKYRGRYRKELKSDRWKKVGRFVPWYPGIWYLRLPIQCGWKFTPEHGETANG